MSFFELRDFADMMRTLGYPRFISVESFRKPNFPLVADILVWLLSKFDVEIPAQYGTEQQRVLLIRTAAEMLATKVQIRVNTKRLYQADGYAVKELLKIISVLYKAIESDESDVNEEEDAENTSNFTHVDISSKIEDIKLARHLASEITTKGANLYELLGKEVDLRENRSIALSKHIELSKAEQAVKEATDIARTELKDVQEKIMSVASTEAALDAKIEKKRLELERTQKRMQNLQRVRPAFMEEFEKLEGELTVLWEEYVVKHRILAAMEQSKHQVEQAEERRHQEQLAVARKLLEASRQNEEMKFLDSTSMDNLSTLDDETKPTVKAPSRMNATAGVKRVFGSMAGTGLDEDEDDSASLLGSDSDLLLGAGQDSDLGTDDDDEIPLGDKMMPSSAAPNMGAGPSGPKPQELSDDDF